MSGENVCSIDFASSADHTACTSCPRPRSRYSSDSREMLPETLLRGQATAVPALQTALCEVEARLGGTRERRARLVLRMDGGFGTTEVLHWVLSRGSQGVATISPSGRVSK